MNFTIIILFSQKLIIWGEKICFLLIDWLAVLFDSLQFNSAPNFEILLSYLLTIKLDWILHADLMRISNFYLLTIVSQIQVSFSFTQTSISFYCSDHSTKLHLWDVTIRNYTVMLKKLNMWCFKNQRIVYRLDSKTLPTL